MSYRNRELASLVAVALITGFGFASVYIARQEVVSTASLSYGIFFLCLYLAAHVCTRLAVPLADPYLLPLGGLLTAIGVTEIYRIDSKDALRQSYWIVVGVAAFALTLFLLRRDYRRLEAYKYVCGLTAVGLLVLPALPVIGQTVNGARLWVHVGSLQFQPGEIAKILLIVFLAGYLREKREVLAQGRLKDFGPLLLVWGAAMLVLVETGDLGSALLYFGIFLAMLYAATGRALFVGVGLVLFIGGAAAAFKSIDRVHERVTTWLDPWAHPHGSGYQTVQALYSIANGGFGGTGLGKAPFDLPDGTPIIPELKTDFIFSALAQELGLIGIAAFLLVFMVFALRGFRVALVADDGFSKLLAVGLAFGFCLQAFIIVGGVLKLIPLTGITLPFVSYGGSSILANFLMLALLMLVSSRAEARRL
ncbi:MAG TPA: FtsW/RodA/SpoVE family cell cycle protein [Gaiellaceae bacterium]|jgi:cell division protein FtsW (lipid II flippase)